VSAKGLGAEHGDVCPKTARTSLGTSIVRAGNRAASCALAALIAGISPAGCGSGADSGSEGASGASSSGGGSPGELTAGPAANTGSASGASAGSSGKSGASSSGTAGSTSASGGSSGTGAAGASSSGTSGDPPSGTSGAAGSASARDAGSASGTSGTGASGTASGTSGASGTGSSGNPSIDAGRAKDASGGSAFPAGWLYTSGNHVYVADGNGGGKVWVGRGVNMDDIFFCGYNNTLYLTAPDTTVEAISAGLMSAWKPTFIRVSLGMNSDTTEVSWFSNPAQYKTPMTNIINSLGAYPNVYVLVTLRSDGSMIGEDEVDGDPEATGIPSDSTTTPNATMYPNGTDPLYQSLVDTFADAKYVLFGLTNEPGGDKLSNSQIASAMSHAIGTIRAEEDKLGVPHHIISVQGNGWTSDISFYSTTPLAGDNLIYEVHGYPPTTAEYTFDNIPVILGEYGSVPSDMSTSLYADLEAKQIPSLAWDFDPYNNCAPDLVNVTSSATSLVPSSWGAIVQPYLLSHAQ